MMADNVVVGCTHIFIALFAFQPIVFIVNINIFGKLHRNALCIDISAYLNILRRWEKREKSSMLEVKVDRNLWFGFVFKLINV